MKNLLWRLLLANVIAVVHSFPDGAPNNLDICKSMKPNHGTAPQSLESVPYKIELDENFIPPGKNLTVILKSTDAAHKMKGFYVQVRDKSGLPIGEFSQGQGYQTGNCGNRKNNAATHKNSGNKDSVTLIWQAPADFEGKVSVVATVVKNYEVFWMPIKSKTLTVAFVTK